MQLLQTLGRWLSWPRPVLPTRYQDGWQASLPPGALGAMGAPDASGFAALRRGLEICSGALLSTPMLTLNADGSEAAGSAAARCLERTTSASWDLAFMSAMSTGNGWLQIRRDDRKAPARLVGIQPHRMSAVLDDEGEVKFLMDGQPVEYSDYVHIMFRNGQSAFVGDALADAYSTSIAAVVAVLTLHGQLHGNGGHAEAYLSTDATLNLIQINQLREAHQAQTQAIQGKAGGVVILASGLKPQILRRLPTALDAEIIKSLDFSVAEASRITGVPLNFLSVKDSTAYASAVESSRSFHRTTIKPMMVRIQRELTEKLGVKIAFDDGEIALGQGKERAETLSKLTQSGILSLNEARQALGYSPAGSDADLLRVPVNLAPADQQQEAP